MNKAYFCDGSLTHFLVCEPDYKNIHIEPNPAGVTHNVSEYLAILWAVSQLPDGDTADVMSDSELAISQINGVSKTGGKYRTKNVKLISLRDKVRRIANGRVQFHWIPREENLAGQLLEDRGGVAWKSLSCPS